MKKCKWPVRLASGCLVILSLVGVAFAAGQQGSQSDPLVTLSYLTEKATPAILAQVDTKIAQRESELTGKLNQVVSGYVQEVSDKLAASGPSGTAGSGTAPSASYAVVTLKQGQKLTGSAGCEFLLRGGTAVCVSSSSPGLVDMTDGSTLSNGGGLVQNHLYLATVDGRGVQASTDATLLVRGSYTVS